MNFKPLFDRVLVSVNEKEGKTKGGIILPEIAKGLHSEGTVVAVGEGKRNEQGDMSPMSLKVGDVVIFQKWQGKEIKLDNEDYLVFKETDILGIKNN